MVRWPEPKPFISKLPCQHDKKSDRIVAKMPMSVGIQVFLLSETDCLFIRPKFSKQLSSNSKACNKEEIV